MDMTEARSWSGVATSGRYRRQHDRFLLQGGDGVVVFATKGKCAKVSANGSVGQASQQWAGCVIFLSED
jgi:hypothetical protein